MTTTEISYCRLCARSKPNSKLLNLQTDQKKLCETIEKLNFINGDTDFSDEILPKTVCLVCIASLDQAFEFVMGIQRAQKVLAGIFVTQNVKQESMCSFEEDSVDPQNDCTVEDIKIEIEPDEQNTEQDESKKSATETKTGESTDEENDVHNSNDKQHFVLSTQIKGFITVEVSKQSNASTSTEALPEEPKPIPRPIPQLTMTWKDYSWPCKICETQFLHIDELVSHSMTYHNVCNAFRCLDCNKSALRLDKFIIHVKRHKKDLKLSCYKCNKTFHTSIATSIHAKEHKHTAYICGGCNLSFSTSELLNEHTKIYFKQTQARSSSLYVPEIKVPEDMKADLTCNVCSKICRDMLSLRRHLMTHTDRPKTHICEKCGKSFLSKANLADHLINLHNNARPYVCEICKATFKTRPRLRKHIEVHDDTKAYTCDQCGKSFRTRKTLKSHTMIHTDSYRYKCSYCDKRFRVTNTLQVHMRQHTGIKPYNCEVCQRAFTNWPNYNKHMKRRHGKDMSKKKRNKTDVLSNPTIEDPTFTEEIISPATVEMKE